MYSPLREPRFVSLNGEVIALSLSNESYFVSVHFINSSKPSFVIENAILACTDSTPFSNGSMGFFYIEREEQLLFYDLKTQIKSCLVTFPPPIDPQDRRVQCWKIEMASDCEYGIVWDYEERFYLLNAELGIISKIDLPRSNNYIKYSSELHKFILADDHVFTIFDPETMRANSFEISNSDSPHQLITTECSCVFMLINGESIEVDLRTCKEIHKYLHYDYDLIALSRDGHELRTGYYHDYALEDWVVYTTTLVSDGRYIPLPYHKDGCSAACFTWDSKYGISGSNNTIAIWSSENGDIVEWHIEGVETGRRIDSLAISHDNKYIGYISKFDENKNHVYTTKTYVTVFDRTRPTNSHELHLENLDNDSTPVARLAFCGNNKICIIACDDGRIIIWSYEENKIIYDKTIHFKEEYLFCHNLVISQDGKKIVYDMSNRTARIVDVSTIISEASCHYRPFYYLPKLHISNCHFKGCVLDSTTREILYQYGAEI